MKRERITPESKEHWLRERTKDVTSTEVAALFGLSPYLTEYELWHIKKTGDVNLLTETDRMFWGNVLEPAIAQAAALKHDWKIRKVNQYVRIPELRMGSSYDFERLDPTRNLEIKNVDGLIFHQQWMKHDDGSIEAPEYIELQVQHQLFVSGRTEATIAVLIGGNDLQILERTLDQQVVDLICQKVALFWESIENDEQPEINYEKDAEFIRQLKKHATPGKHIDPTDEIDKAAAKYIRAAGIIKKVAGIKKAAGTRILELIDDAEKCEAEGYSISAGYVAPTTIETYERAGYRNLRVTASKKKGKK